MHALFECTVMMRLVMSFIHGIEIIKWLKDTESEWYERLMTWQTIVCPATLQYAFKVGDICKLKSCVDAWKFGLPCASIETWHTRTWQFVSDGFVSELWTCSSALFSIEDLATIDRVLPFFQLPRAAIDVQIRFLCEAIGILKFDAFVKLFTECKFPPAQQILCQIFGYNVCNTKRAKPVLKWLVAQLETPCDEVSKALCRKPYFFTSQYFVAKYLIKTGRMNFVIRNELFHAHLLQSSSSSPKPEFHKMTLVLWQKGIFLANYFLPFVTTFSTYYLHKWQTDNNNGEMTTQLKDAWLSLSLPHSDKSLDDDSHYYYYGSSAPNDMSSGTEDDDCNKPTKFEAVNYSMVKHKSLECPIQRAQSKLHDAVCNQMTSSLAHAFMSHVSVVHEWTQTQFCTAFEHTCQRGRLSLACLLWNMAPPSVQPFLTNYLWLAFKSNNPKFLQFAWDRAPEKMHQVVPEAAHFALQHGNFNTWQFMHDKQLLTEKVLFGDKHKLWNKLCCVPLCFLKLVWPTTQLWRVRFHEMIDIALQADRRRIVMFLSKQDILLDQSWLRSSIVELTRNNLHRLLEKIHDPQTLDLECVQNCYSLLFIYNYTHLNETWWNMYPLTREQLLGVPYFKWTDARPSLMRHLWRDGIASVYDLREYVNGSNDAYKTELFTFDLDQNTIAILENTN